MAKESTEKITNKNEEKYEVPLEEALKLAQGHHHTGNFILAERTYRDILRAVPDHYPTTHFLGILLFQSGNFSDALHFLTKATESEPDNADCWSNYGAVLTQKKQYEGAIDAFNKALECNPEHIDALNNRAYALWALDFFEEAEQAAIQLLEIDPDNISALTNLGMAQARLKKYQKSLETWRKASEIDPEDANIWTNWGNTLKEMGRVAASEAPCRKAVELAPNNPEALNNIANTLRDLGEIEKAIEYYRSATNIRPNFPEAHNNLAIALIDIEKYKEAAVAARYAIAFKDDYAPAYRNLSKSLSAIGEYNQAHMAAQKAMHLNPDSVDSYLDLADVLLRADRLDDGEAALQEALKREPDSARCYMRLAEIKDLTNDIDDALEAINKALELTPDIPVFMLRKARILSTINETDEALKIIDKIIETAPGFIGARQLKAETLISINENEKAEEIAREIITLTDRYPGPYYTLTNLKTFESEDDEDFIAMKEIAKDVEDGNLDEQLVINYALSNVYEQMDNYDAAFDHLKKANDIKRKLIPYDPSRFSSTYEGVKNWLSPEFIKNHEGQGCDSQIPVFIVGMPRSGTTLTEQILAAHPDVFGAGELPEIAKIRSELRMEEELDVKALGEEYIKNVTEKDKSGKAKRITDKMPGNYLNIGLIISILPNAKIIHCRRNPIDTCLSCYKQNFARGQYWSYDLEEMADEYKRYLDMMEYWRTLFPNRILEIDYEETVNDLETQARKLIEHVGLEWNDACLKPHKQKRVVLTASKAQVTKPVYKTSVDKWKRYEKGLQPLIKKLMPEAALKEA